MKFPKIKQSELNTFILFGIGIAFILALFSYLHKIKNTEGFAGSSNWKLTTDDGDVALQYKRRSKFKVSGDGTIKNTVIDTIKQKLAEIERKLNVVPKAPAPAPVPKAKSPPPQPIWVWGIDRGGKLYKRQEDSDKDWELVPCKSALGLKKTCDNFGSIYSVEASEKDYVWANGDANSNIAMKCKKPCTGDWLTGGESATAVQAAEQAPAEVVVAAANDIYSSAVGAPHLSAYGRITTTGKDWIWALGSKYPAVGTHVYKCKKPCSGKDWEKWIKQDTNLERYIPSRQADKDWRYISANDTHVWGNAGGTNLLVKRSVDGDKSDLFISAGGISGDVNWIDATGKNYIRVINAAGTVYKCKRPCANPGTWIKVSETPQMRIISADG